ncbi:MAG: hypothetical protein DRQ63_10760 [Gammaproteobacteria bacterium]|nr:MAG: hypothetical protein DRQ63_10760 [Gammaproteobacteria bacterium]
MCEQLLEDLLPLVRGRLETEIVNIDDDAELGSEYGTRIPVLEFAGQFVCQYTLDHSAIRGILDSLSK